MMADATIASVPTAKLAASMNVSDLREHNAITKVKAALIPAG